MIKYDKKADTVTMDATLWRRVRVIPFQVSILHMLDEMKRYGLTELPIEMAKDAPDMILRMLEGTRNIDSIASQITAVVSKDSDDLATLLGLNDPDAFGDKDKRDDKEQALIDNFMKGYN